MSDIWGIGKTVLYAGPRAVDADYFPVGGVAITGIRAILEMAEVVVESYARHKMPKSRRIRVPYSTVPLACKDDEIVLQPGTALARRYKVLRQPRNDDDTLRVEWLLDVGDITL